MAEAVERAWIDFHGIAVKLAYEPLTDDVLGSLLAPFPTAPPSTAGVRVVLDVTDVACAAPHADFRPCFFYGIAQAYIRDDQYALYDGRTLIEVTPKRGEINGRLCRPDPAAVSTGMQHVALALVLREHRVFDIHAAGACDGSRAFLLFGDSGSGKTTALLGMIAAGLGFLGDDRVLFRSRSGELELLAYPRDFHVSPRSLAAIGLASSLVPPVHADGRHRLPPLRIWPNSLCSSWRGARVLLFPEIVNATTSRVRALSPAEAFGKLLASSAMVAQEAVRHAQQQIADLKLLAETSPAWQLLLGSDALSAPGATAARITREVRP